MKKILIFLITNLFLTAYTNAQVAAFQKKVLDSLPAQSWLGNIGAGINLNSSTSRKLIFTGNANLMYLSNKHSYNLLSSVYANRIDNEGDDDRAYALAQFNLFHHSISNHIVKEKKLNPELFTLFQFDRARGIKERWQYGANIVWNNSKLKNIRFNLGTGIFFENEKWRIFSKDDYAIWDTLPPVVKDLIRELLKMDDRDNVVRNNTRWNVYLNAYCHFGSVVSLNTFFSVQTPFKPPYKDLPALDGFPTVTKIYPRYTIEAILFIKISKKFQIETRAYLQHDKGQISPYTPDEIFNISQGFSYTF